MNFLDKILKIVFPDRCPCCSKVSDSYKPCDRCAKLLNECRFDGKICKKCGNEIKFCDCKRFNYLFTGVCAPFKNVDKAQETVYGLKFLNRPYAAEYLGKEMAKRFIEVFSDKNIDFICFVPTHRRLNFKRDYDYIRLLAKQVATELGIPLRSRILKKIKYNKRQHKLSFNERKLNVKGVFSAVGDLTGKTVLLVDDIKTTGYTLNECAKQLRLAGAENVYCLTALISSNNTCKVRQSKI